MSQKPQCPVKFCAKAGCIRLTRGRFCQAHADWYRKQADKRRPSAAVRGYGSRWRRESKRYLDRHPICEGRFVCRGNPATQVDHIRPIAGGGDMWDEGNWQGLCPPCHSHKTATEDGAFGNPRRGSPACTPSAQKMRSAWPRG